MGATMTEERTVWAVEIDWPPPSSPRPELPRPGVHQAVTTYLARLPQAVWADAHLEGNTATLADVDVVMGGGTPGDISTDEVNQVRDLAKAAQLVAATALTGPQSVTKPMADRLNGVLARHEAIEAGMFRGEGRVGGGGTVNAMGATFHAPVAGPDGSNLKRLFDQGLAMVAAIESVPCRAVTWAAYATYNQFYFDGNKRTGRAIANLLLLSHGFDAIVLRPKDTTTYNQALATLFVNANPEPYVRLLLTRMTCQTGGLNSPRHGRKDKPCAS